jgi:hypothetical protein
MRVHCNCIIVKNVKMRVYCNCIIVKNIKMRVYCKIVKNETSRAPHAQICAHGLLNVCIHFHFGGGRGVTSTFFC